ncbi:MAG: low molecular weight phosphotyrosine protein phosphatase [Alphaproteobacteria bacterium]|nr:low molecular weight phosphotyrosine protein phosphatase [Alphaproteobacteria bacterium]
MAATAPVGVLFICTGNTCRSPTAEGVFATLAARAGRAGDFAIDSAGTGVRTTGEPPSPRAIAAARRRGYDLSGLRARPLAHDDVARFTHVLAMDRGHLRLLREQAPPTLIDRPRLFLTGAGLANDEVADPWGGGEADYERSLDQIEAGCRALLARV